MQSKSCNQTCNQKHTKKSCNQTCIQKHAVRTLQSEPYNKRRAIKNMQSEPCNQKHPTKDVRPQIATIKMKFQFHLDFAFNLQNTLKQSQNISSKTKTQVCNRAKKSNFRYLHIVFMFISQIQKPQNKIKHANTTL